MSTPTEKNSTTAGIISVVIMVSLALVATYAIVILNAPSHYEMCSTGGPAKWAIWNFYFSFFGGAIGGIYELYLVIIGKVFEVQTVPVIPRIRGFNAGYIFTVGLIFDAFMVLGTGYPGLLNGIVFFLGIAGTLIAPGMAFPASTAETVGQAYFGGMTVLSMIMILWRGTAFGGTKTMLCLAVNKASSAVGAIVTPPNKSLQNNIQFHILRLIANILVIVGYLNATSESPCFPQEAEAHISHNFLPVLGASVILGWVFHVTYDNYMKKSDYTAI